MKCGYVLNAFKQVKILIHYEGAMFVFVAWFLIQIEMFFFR